MKVYAITFQLPGAVGEVEITERIEGMGGKRSVAVCSMSRQTRSHSSLSAATLLHTTSITQHPAQTPLQLQLCHHKNKTTLTNTTIILIKQD